MIFVFGGAFQGKLDFAKEKFNIDNEQVLLVGEDFDVSKITKDVRCVYGISEWVHNLMESGASVEDSIEELIIAIKNLKEKKNSQVVLIANDVSQGLVPIDAKERAYREANGRAMIRLAAAAKEVYRVFCGIGVQIK